MSDTDVVGPAHPDLEKAWADLTAIAEEIANVETGAPGFLRHTYDKALREVDKEAVMPLVK